MANRVEEFRQAVELAERLRDGNYPLQPRGPMFYLIEKARAFLDEYDSLNL